MARPSNISRLPGGDYPFNEDPPQPGVVRWWVENGEGGGWLVWAPPDWDGDRSKVIPDKHPPASPWA